jgi:hypothetical protein
MTPQDPVELTRIDLDAAIGDYDVRDAVIEDFRICQVIVS